jgi:hypothetical protein
VHWVLVSFLVAAADSSSTTSSFNDKAMRKSEISLVISKLIFRQSLMSSS